MSEPRKVEIAPGISVIARPISPEEAAELDALRVANGKALAASQDGAFAEAAADPPLVELIEWIWHDPVLLRQAREWFLAAAETRGPPPANARWLFRLKKQDEAEAGAAESWGEAGDGAEAPETPKKKGGKRHKPIVHPPGGPVLLATRICEALDGDRLDESVLYQIGWLGIWDRPPIWITDRVLVTGKYLGRFGADAATRKEIDLYTKIVRRQRRDFGIPEIVHPRSSGMQTGPNGNPRYVIIEREDYFTDDTRVYELRGDRVVLCDLASRVITDSTGHAVPVSIRPDPEDIAALADFLVECDPAEPGGAGRAVEMLAYASGAPLDNRDLVPLREALAIIGPSEHGKTAIAAFIAEMFAPYPGSTTSDYHPTNDTARSIENVADAIKGAPIVADDIHEAGGNWQILFDGLVSAKADGGPIRRRNTPSLTAAKKTFIDAPIILTAEGLPGAIASRQRRLLAQITRQGAPIDFDHFWPNRARYLEIGRRVMHALTVHFLIERGKPGGLDRLRSRVRLIVDRMAADLAAVAAERRPGLPYWRSACRAHADAWARAVLLDEGAGCRVGIGLADIGEGPLTERLRPHLADLVIAQLDAMAGGAMAGVDWREWFHDSIRRILASGRWATLNQDLTPLSEASGLNLSALAYAVVGEDLKSAPRSPIAYWDHAAARLLIEPQTLLAELRDIAQHERRDFRFTGRDLPKALFEAGLVERGAEGDRIRVRRHIGRGAQRSLLAFFPAALGLVEDDGTEPPPAAPLPPRSDPPPPRTLPGPGPRDYGEPPPWVIDGPPLDAGAAAIAEMIPAGEPLAPGLDPGAIPAPAPVEPAAIPATAAVAANRPLIFASLGLDGLHIAEARQGDIRFIEHDELSRPEGATDSRMARLVERHGITQLWRHPDWCEAAGLPQKIARPEGEEDWKRWRGVPHPSADTLPEGWRRHSKPGHLVPWLEIERGDEGTIEIVTPHLGLGGGNPPFHKASSTRVLLESVLAFKRATGFAFRINPAAMLGIMVKRLHSGRGSLSLDFPAMPEGFPEDLTRLSNATRQILWGRPLNEAERAAGSLLYAADGNAAYLAAMSGVPVGFGVPEHAKRAHFEGAREKRAGWWIARVALPANWPAELPDPRFPKRGLNPAIEPLPYTTLHMQFLAEIGCAIDDGEAWLFPKTRRPLEPVYRVLRTALPALAIAAGKAAPPPLEGVPYPELPGISAEAASIALVTGKLVYSAGTGTIGKRGVEASRTVRAPYWAQALVSRFRTNQMRAIIKAGLRPFALRADAIYLASPHTDPQAAFGGPPPVRKGASGGLHLDAAPGHYKPIPEIWGVPVEEWPAAHRSKLRLPQDLDALKTIGGRRNG